MSNEPKMFMHNPAVPFDPTVDLYRNMGYTLTPHEYTGWRDETNSWKETCYLGTSLTPSPAYRVKGPGALKFMSSICVNGFNVFPVGKGKHGIACQEDGIIMADGVILRTAEDEFETFWMSPWIEYMLQKEKWNAEGEDITMNYFIFQVAGPKSLEILNAATCEDLSDIKFTWFRPSKIAGIDVRIFRLGMAGSLAYEVHGLFQDGPTIYQAIHDAGKPYGIRQLGNRSYMMNHTENGFPQAYYHFTYPWWEDKGLAEYMIRINSMPGMLQKMLALHGSAGTDMMLRYRNPVELGWAGVIRFDHDFLGRAALEKLVAKPPRTMVTLEWNKEDILDVHASQYEPGEHYLPLDEPNHHPMSHGTGQLWSDLVLVNGKVVGISSGRCYSYWYRQMISLCSIDPEFSAIGTEVVVLWGEPGMRQKEIRAKVARFPYLNEGRNESVDVSK